MTNRSLREKTIRITAGVGMTLLFSLAWMSIVSAQPDPLLPQGFISNNVGGVAIDPRGAVVDVRREVRDSVSKLREELASEVSDEIKDGIQLRKFSLRALQQAVMQVQLAKGPRTLPPEIRYLAGIQRVQYIFVYPEDNDIVLAGPGESWRIDDLGDAVGTTTGKPVLHLQDLLVALRSVFNSEPQVITCSIDPTPGGIVRMRTFLTGLAGKRPLRNPAQITAHRREIEDSLGPQIVTVQGVDTTSRFAWTLVAADYRMKRLAMGFEEAPVKEMPSFVKLMGTRPARNMMPRWWMEDSYDAILTDGQGLAWELRGQGVKVLSEDELVADNGARKGTGKVNPIAKRWAETMTEKFNELSAAEPVFGQLRNCMDLAVLSALIRSENLHQRAGMDMGLLLNANTVATPSMPAPRTAPSQVSFLVKGKHLAITASGGVQINPWKVVGNREKTDMLTAVRDDAIAPAGAKWFWD